MDQVGVKDPQEQGRLAACHAFHVPTRSVPELFPYGIYAIPEISFVGRTEEELTEAAIPYVAGVAWWRELAKAMMMREEDGLLKILVSPEDRRLLGVMPRPVRVDRDVVQKGIARAPEPHTIRRPRR